MEVGNMNEGFVSLLRIKDSEIRILCLEQGRDAVDRGIHIGGAFSAVVPLVALYYGGCMRYSVEEPTKLGQDMFVLSKGHAVATLASIYADLGYFDKNLLKNSRSQESLLNGHPGPLLPGIHIATGPEGHGLGVAQGFALAGKEEPRFDVFCLTGDGEIQAGMIWEAVMYAGAKKVDNLCLLVDVNGGQLDNPRATAFPMNNMEGWFESFGWKVVSVDSTDYPALLQALGDFKQSPRSGIRAFASATRAKFLPSSQPRKSSSRNGERSCVPNATRRFSPLFLPRKPPRWPGGAGRWESEAKGPIPTVYR